MTLSLPHVGSGDASGSKLPRILAETVVPRRAVPKPALPIVGIGAYRQLGAWIDVFDYNNDPSTIVPLVDQMAGKGTKTLFLETSRYQAPADIQFPTALGAALDRAKARGMKVVAWYPPAFDDVGRDVRRSLAAVHFRSPNGNRFDGFASDIEYTQNVPDANSRNLRTIDYSKQLRRGAGLLYPLGAITITPTSLEYNPNRWPNFPWAQIKSLYNVFMPMNYWTGRSTDPKFAADITRQNVEKTKALTGKPVNIIGGLAEQADVSQVAAYVNALRSSGAIGGGVYDFKTTRSDVWGELRKLNG